MYYCPAFILFINQPGVDKFSCVLRYCFYVAGKCVGDLVKINPLLPRDQKQNFNAPVVSRAFEVSFQLLCCFKSLRHYIVTTK